MIQRHGVPLVALLVFAGELGVPTGVPVEVALLVAGSYAIHSLPDLLVGLFLVVAADILGTTTLHLVARTGGVRLLSWLVRREGAGGVDIMERWRRRLGCHDVAVVFVGRLLPLVRMPVTVAAGLLRLRLRDFLAGAAPAAAIWAGLPLTLGYLFRADVGRFATRYTRFSHLFLVAMPAIGIIGGLAWWVRGGGSVRAKVRRGRSALGLAAVVGSVAYVVKTAWANERATDHGLAALPYPLLGVWLALLAVLALALLGVALADLRVAMRGRARHGPLSRLVVGEIATTLAWVGLVAVVGAIAIGIELRYPAL